MKFALKNLLKEKKSFLLYGITVMLSFCICQIFIGILDNPYFRLETNSYNQMYMGSLISLIVIFMCCFLLIYTSQYFIASKSKELGLLRGLGFSLKNLTAYLIYQNIFIFVCFGILAISLSFVLYPSILYIIKLFLDKHLVIDHLTVSSVLENIGLFISIFVVVVMSNIGFVYRNQLNKLLDKDVSTRNRKMKINKFVYPCIYIISFILMITVEHNEVGYVLYSLLCAVGSYGIMKCFLPSLFEKNKERYNSTQRMIILGHLNKRLKNMSMFSFMNIVMSTVLISLMCFNLNNNKEFLRILLAFIVIYMFLVSSITYKNYLLIDDEMQSLHYIRKLGIKKEEVKIIIKKELQGYYSILIVLPFIYICAILIRFYIYNQLGMGILVFLLLYFTIFQLISLEIISLITLRRVE